MVAYQILIIHMLLMLIKIHVTNQTVPLLELLL